LADFRDDREDFAELRFDVREEPRFDVFDDLDELRFDDLADLADLADLDDLADRDPFGDAGMLSTASERATTRTNSSLIEVREYDMTQNDRRSIATTSWTVQPRCLGAPKAHEYYSSDT
jgi:hypothetical protein